MGWTVYQVGVESGLEAPVSAGIPADATLLRFAEVAGAQASVSAHPPDAIIANPSDAEGRNWVSAQRRRDPSVAVIMIASAGSAADPAVTPLFHLRTPFSATDLRSRLEVQLEKRAISLELAELRDAMAQQSRALRASKERVSVATERLVTAEQLAAVGRVVGGLAHEIGRHLALVGYAEAIRTRVEGDEELTELAEVIVAAQRRLSKMVDEIRDFAVTADSEDLRAEPAELGTIVDEALAVMRYDRDFRARKLKRVFHKRPLVSINRQKIEQVVINLLSNAVLATEPGDEIVVELTNDHKNATLRVVDAGVGMSPAVQARLGEIFFTTRGERGSGLGVGICMRIAQEHGGALTFESSPGQGTTAQVSLPLIREAAL